jgi:Iron-sulfur cluster-binding domain
MPNKNRTPQQQAYLDQHVCALPFYRMEIKGNGEVRSCCEQWTDLTFGNLLETTIEDIWHGETARQIRSSMTNNGTRQFNGCRANACENIKNRRLESNDFLKRQNVLNSDKLEPVELEFNLDRTCNLWCGSCRQNAIHDVPESEYQHILDVFRKATRPYLTEPHSRPMVINLDGSGEVFASRAYRTLFDTELCFTQPHLWPNLRYTLQTNGTLLTTKLQTKYSAFVSRIRELWVSIDAGDLKSYRIVRRGGDWDLLWENLDAYYQAIRTSEDRRWVWNLIIQRDNFESIPLLVERAMTYTDNLPWLSFTDLVNWGTYTPEAYLARAVHNTEHPLWPRLQEILEINYVKNYPRKIYR